MTVPKESAAGYKATGTSAQNQKKSEWPGGGGG